MRNLLLFVVAFLTACTPTPSAVSRTDLSLTQSLPAMKSFGLPPMRRATRSNADIARDFMDLSFRMESGRALPVFTRFEGPITLRVVGAAPVSMAPDLGKLLQRLRREAGLNIQITQSPRASINIVAVSKQDMNKFVPNAACFVVPNVADWSDFRQYRRDARVDWAQLRDRRQVGIFVPTDAAPQELRDCLHEEIAQALGPLNDLYRLPDSVFNDDNIHTVLTGFDMLILKATYAPELRNGMTEREVAAVLPAVLDRLNPAGARVAVRNAPTTSRAWIDEMHKALGAAKAPRGRRAAAQNAVSMASSFGFRDTRQGFSQYALGRLTIASNPRAAKEAFHAADRIYMGAPETLLHRAYVAVQLAAFALIDGDAERVLQIVEPHIRTAVAYENAALLSSLLMFRAEALELQGRASEANAVRLDSVGWARYGYGSKAAIDARLREIELLNPAKQGQL
ncbi:MAG: DUF2927 domain-containing protein [Shimia sp.]